MENKMSEVAKLLELELREEFKIKGLSPRYRFTKIGLQYYNATEKGWYLSNKLLSLLLTGELSIIEVEHPILDEKEKEYLSSVIKPFKDSVVAITKCKYGDYYEFIQIEVNQEKYEYVDLPNFKKGIMYKGMKIDKVYTLEELGL